MTKQLTLAREEVGGGKSMDFVLLGSVGTYVWLLAEGRVFESIVIAPGS